MTLFMLIFRFSSCLCSLNIPLYTSLSTCHCPYLILFSTLNIFCCPCVAVIPCSLSLALFPSWLFLCIFVFSISLPCLVTIIRCLILLCNSVTVFSCKSCLFFLFMVVLFLLLFAHMVSCSFIFALLFAFFFRRLCFFDFYCHLFVAFFRRHLLLAVFFSIFLCRCLPVVVLVTLSQTRFLCHCLYTIICCPSPSFILLPHCVSFASYLFQVFPGQCTFNIFRCCCYIAVFLLQILHRCDSLGVLFFSSKFHSHFSSRFCNLSLTNSSRNPALSILLCQLF